VRQSDVTISVVTVCRNAARTIEQNLRSVAAQDYAKIDHCVVDGQSTDGTVEVLRSAKENIHWVSEPDDGIYDAMNKGIAMAKGDIIGFLNADDRYAHPHVLSDVARVMQNGQLDACFADIEFRDEQNRLLRRYDSSRFCPERLVWGWMPAHPSLYVRKEVFENYGGFRTDYRIAADYEFVTRIFARGQCHYRYVRDVWVYMRPGGVSTRGLHSSWILNREIVRACRENGLRTNLFKVLMKLPLKLAETMVHKR